MKKQGSADAELAAIREQNLNYLTEIELLKSDNEYLSQINQDDNIMNEFYK